MARVNEGRSSKARWYASVASSELPPFALALQRSQSMPDAPDSASMPLSHAKESEGLWNTLRSTLLVMNRADLVPSCHVGSNLDVFRQAGFDF